MNNDENKSTGSESRPTTSSETPGAEAPVPTRNAVGQGGGMSPQEVWLRFAEVDDAILEQFGWSSSKIGDRGVTFEESETEPGKFILSIERHRGICGARYTKGLPLAAFQTYMQRLLFDPVTLALSKLDDVVIDENVDTDALACQMLDGGFKPVVRRSPKEGMRRVTYENCLSSTLVETDSLEVACKTLEDDLNGVDLEMNFCCYDGPKQWELADDLRHQYIEMALDVLRKSWRDFDPNDDLDDD